MGEYKTPGVYIKEKNAFGNSIVEVETAIPVFIGLTGSTTRISEVRPHLSSCFLLKRLRMMTRINICFVFLIMKRKWL